MPTDYLVIFDCDGVLIDSEPIASRTLAEALQAAHVDISAVEVHREFTGNAEAEIKKLCTERHGLRDADRVFSGWHRHLRQAFAEELQPMAGMVELVTTLRADKCVASNSRVDRLENSLGLTALWALFSGHVYSAEMVARPKPAPDLLLHCAAAFARNPDNCIMVDDSPHGIDAARAAGMTAIGYVDPRDSRPNRKSVLHNAGADRVAVGSAELAGVLAAIGVPFAARS